MKQERPDDWKNICEAGVQTMIKNAVNDLDEGLIECFKKAIDRKMTLPATHISAHGLVKHTLWRFYGNEWRTKMNHVKMKACYRVVADMIRERGGVITDFKTVRKGGEKGNRGSNRAIFELPPLKERKT